MQRSQNILKVVISWIFVTMLIISPLSAKPQPHPIVRKAIPVQQSTTPAKVVSGDGSQTALVVLPPGFEKHDVVVADSQEYKDLLAKNKELEKQVQDEQNKINEFAAQTDRVKQDQVKALEAEQKHGSSIFSYLHWISWLGGGSIILGSVALIVLCFIFPELIPIVVKWLISFIEAFFGVLHELGHDFGKLFEKKTPVPVATPKS